MTGKMQDGGFYGWWLLPVLCLVYSIPIGFALYVDRHAVDTLLHTAQTC
jgi:hypothetical protein